MPSPRRAALMAAALCVAAAVVAPRAARATIEEQRARLPPAAQCADENVAGIWRSHTYRARRMKWQVFTLEVRRVEGSPHRLEGTITNHSWHGSPEHTEPPPCSELNYSEWIVSMDAVGRVHDDGRIEFGGVGAWRLDRVICYEGPGGYYLDQFTGVIDPRLLEFQSVNNDGGPAVNEPTLFRRIRCPPVRSARSPSVNPIPPAFYPDRSSGCMALLR